MILRFRGRVLFTAWFTRRTIGRVALRIRPGTHLDDALYDARHLAAQLGCAVEFFANGVVRVVSPDGSITTHFVDSDAMQGDFRSRLGLAPPAPLETNPNDSIGNCRICGEAFKMSDLIVRVAGFSCPDCVSKESSG